MKIHHFGIIDSTFDKAWELICAGRLEVWDSVQAKSQTAGRGQLRSAWVSQPGNVFVTLRLPFEKPFISSAGALAIATMCLAALRQQDERHLLLKWPNDLVFLKENILYKFGGILLEEKEGVILAGIGINLVEAPQMKDLDDPDSLPPGALSQLRPQEQTADAFWQTLVLKMRACWPELKEGWLKNANKWLALRGDNVCITEQTRRSCGILINVESDGACQLDVNGQRQLFMHGAMRENNV